MKEPTSDGLKDLRVKRKQILNTRREINTGNEGVRKRAMTKKLFQSHISTSNVNGIDVPNEKEELKSNLPWHIQNRSPLTDISNSNSEPKPVVIDNISPNTAGKYTIKFGSLIKGITLDGLNGSSEQEKLSSSSTFNTEGYQTPEPVLFHQSSNGLRCNSSHDSIQIGMDKILSTSTDEGNSKTNPVVIESISPITSGKYTITKGTLLKQTILNGLNGSSKTETHSSSSSLNTEGYVTPESGLFHPTSKVKLVKHVSQRSSIINGLRWNGSDDSILNGRDKILSRSSDEGVVDVQIFNIDQSSYNVFQRSKLTFDHVLFEESEQQECCDFGDCNYCCEFCGALVWYQERSEKSKRPPKPDFSICCMKGKIQLPLLQKPPDLLWNLFNNNDDRSFNFLQNIRQYNSMFSFTSIGGKVDNSLNNGSGPPQFIISGQNYHRIGSLLPQEGNKPKFAQLYIYDTDNEISNRMTPFSASRNTKFLDHSIVQDLKEMVDEHNVLAHSFRRVKDHFESSQFIKLSLRLFRNRSRDARMYNLPTADEVAALIVGDFDNSDIGRDIVVECHNGVLKRIHETHPAFIPLQYPILFPYGEDGYQEDISIRECMEKDTNRKRTRVSLREFVAFRIQERESEFGNIVNARRLFQQFLVDSYSMIEAQRLSFIRTNQSSLRSDILNGLEEAVHRGETNSATIGMRIILPSSFTGGMRYMFNNCQDAMAVCKKFGYPDLFITVTCNPQWPEIRRFVCSRNLSADDRPDISCRIFQIKLDQMMSDFKRGLFFGKVIAGMYTIEFQKRGLPHAHILLWLHPDDKLETVDLIDNVISAELPDKLKFPKLFNVVSSFMMHGPCGAANRTSPCMKEGKCSKFFPKKFVEKTSFDADGYPIYRRRDTGITTSRKGVELDNRYVVPYNPKLLMKYQAHINIEFCNKSNSIKYLFKYVNKGPDRVTISVSSEVDRDQHIHVVDEIQQYYDCRYLSPCESVWRIFGFEIHSRWPPVQRLTFHLPNKQSIIFKDNDNIDEVVTKNKEKSTMFLAWMEANKFYPEGRNLTYGQFPIHFVYNKEKRQWFPRKKGQSIGRLHFVPPGTGELYYMRLLLTFQIGCTTFESIRTVNGRTYETFQKACFALGLLSDDKEFIDGIKETAKMASGNYLRNLFVTLLVSNTMSRPSFVWEQTWECLADGILYQRRILLNNKDLEIGNDDLKNLCLIEIENLLHTNGRSLKDFDCMPLPSNSPINQFENKLLVNELNYNRQDMLADHQRYFSLLTDEQKRIYNQVIDAVNVGKGGFFFVYGYGGTGKTFVWKTLSTALRSEGKVVLNVASSGIASLLLPGGRTAHSKFSIPFSLTEESTCNIKQGSFKAELLCHTSLIIWDEAPMISKWAFEALDRTMRDIMKFCNEIYSHQPFGGKVVVLGGDFRQILPVIPKGSREDIVMATVNSSKLWNQCKVLTLTKNMRLQTGSNNLNLDEIKSFAEWIIKLGDGELGSDNDGEAEIEIPHDLLIMQSDNHIASIVDFAYPNLIENMKDFKFFEDRAILAPTLEVVEQVNQFILSTIPTDAKEYLSSDSISVADEDVSIEAEWFTTEFLNEIKCSGMPNHRLTLKKGVPVMLLRNIDQALGLCNGTRLIVDDLGKNVIGATIVTGKQIGEKIYIPRMNLIPSDPGMPIKFQRRQFPLTVCFAMTINKSQGQTLSHVGIFLPRPVFTHGQLYVAVSRVKARSGLKILILDENGNLCQTTKNVVYKEVFQKIRV